MTTNQFRSAIAAQCGFTPNKAKDDDDTCPKCGSAACTHIWELDAQQGEKQEPTSFSAWLERNNDSIEPLDRTEATAQWFDEREENCE